LALASCPEGRDFLAHQLDGSRDNPLGMGLSDRLFSH